MTNIQIFTSPADVNQANLLWGNMPLPHNCKLIGTVTKGNGDLGAAITGRNEIINANAFLCQGNAGTLVTVASAKTLDHILNLKECYR